MENLDSDNDESPGVGDMETCHYCGKEIREGQGRFRRPKGVFCIDCYPDNSIEPNSRTMSPTLRANN